LIAADIASLDAGKSLSGLEPGSISYDHPLMLLMLARAIVPVRAISVFAFNAAHG
jgi:hypothetical protein